MRQASDQPRQKSALHRKVAKLLREIYPGFTILEEESLKTVVDDRKTTLFVDIVVRELSVVIECHGRQHFEFVPHFHQTRDQFAQAVARDRAKAQTVIDAGYSYVVVRFDEESKLTQGLLMTKIITALEKPDDDESR